MNPTDDDFGTVEISHNDAAYFIGFRVISSRLVKLITKERDHPWHKFISSPTTLDFRIKGDFNEAVDTTIMSEFMAAYEGDGTEDVAYQYAEISYGKLMKYVQSVFYQMMTETDLFPNKIELLYSLLDNLMFEVLDQEVLDHTPLILCYNKHFPPYYKEIFDELT